MNGWLNDQSHQTPLSLRSHNARKLVNALRDRRKICKFARYSPHAPHTTASQRPFSVHITFPQRQEVAVARSRRTHCAHTACIQHDTHKFVTFFIVFTTHLCFYSYLFSLLNPCHTSVASEKIAERRGARCANASNAVQTLWKRCAIA